MTDVYVVSGFLGSGKTTLINHLLDKNDEKILIVENEVGDRSIDGDFLKREDVEVENLLSGCICCTLATDFRKVVDENQMFDKIIIEPSGVALLSTVLDVFREDEPVYTVTIIDPDEFLENLEFFGAFFPDQVENAGTLVVNLREEKDYKKEKEKLRELNADAHIFDINLLEESINFEDIKEKSQVYQGKEFTSDELGMDTLNIENASYSSEEDLKKDIENKLDSAKIYRVKGYALIGGEVKKVDMASSKWYFEEASDEVNNLVVIYQD